MENTFKYHIDKGFNSLEDWCDYNQVTVKEAHMSGVTCGYDFVSVPADFDCNAVTLVTDETA